MKAAQLFEYGGKEAVRINSDAPKPTAGPGEVIVEIHAAAVNPYDYKVRDGLYKDFMDLQLPATLGGDCSGVVAEIGEGVKGFEIGQEVFGMAGAASGKGSFAEYAPVTVKQLAPKPAGLDHVTAAALPLTAVSAYQALIDTMHLTAGQRILIHGGAGGIGSMAIQIAKDAGAYVATTGREENNDYLKELGADEIIDYTKQDFSSLIKDYDAVFDTVGGETNAKSYGVLKPGGILVSMVEEADEAKAAGQGITAVHQFSKATPERLSAVTRLTESGKLKVHVDKVFTLDQAAEALEHLKSGRPAGKVVIRVR